MNRNPMQISAALEVVTPQSAAFAAKKSGVTRPVTLKGAEGKTLICVEGNLWVTQSGSPMDHILAAGEKLSLSGKGSVVVSAFPQGSYILD